MNREFGDVFLHYAQTGKTPIEAFEDNDDYVFNNNINALRYMSGEFNIWWSNSTEDSEITSTKERLRNWLKERDVVLEEHEEVVVKKIRFRTLGDITITGGIESDADTVEKIIAEVATLKQTERGNRSDDKRSDSAMEDRKRQGYF